ncbi:type-F conjugative transfer system pilin assembly protein TrbC [Arcobacter lacus]|uniref:type-F conjugative transfer system pilin assembly protein TrbC n=1 Tax=Arcobacter lacus TaxID=1912876 RepID=UPI0021BBA4CE|nr:type-F conjugative transfer system pilin assembly protein TrbC [Arcobacter lacus]MCT7910364.1 type-F conjugative transfer system pilin assembly protein TrbC [Arcobacter lacus]
MNNKRIFFALILASTLVADKFDVIKKIEDSAFKKAQELDLSSLQKNMKEQNFDDNLSQIYSNTLKNVEIETKRMQGENVFLENMKENKFTKKELDFQKFLKNNRIYIFMSESVPMDVWHTYGKLMYDKKLTNSNMVIRGCIGGNCSKIGPTVSFIIKLKQYDKNNEINPNVMIDPLLFKKYNITQVPCIVFAEDAQTKDLTQSEGKDENFNAKNVYKSCGDWNLVWHLKDIQKKANNYELEQIINYLEPKGGV